MTEHELKLWNRALSLRLELGDEAELDDLGRKIDQVRAWAQRLIYDACPDESRVREAQTLIHEKHPWIDGSNMALLESQARFEADRDGKSRPAETSAHEIWQLGWEGQMASADWAVTGRD